VDRRGSVVGKLKDKDCSCINFGLVTSVTTLQTGKITDFSRQNCRQYVQQMWVFWNTNFPWTSLTKMNYSTNKVQTGKLFCWAATIKFPWLTQIPRPFPDFQPFPWFSMTLAKFSDISRNSWTVVTLCHLCTKHVILWLRVEQMWRPQLVLIRGSHWQWAKTSESCDSRRFTNQFTNIISTTTKRTPSASVAA